MRSTRPLLAVVLAALLLAGCQSARPTAYAPAVAKGDYGYSETRIDGQTWRIQVAGNNRTDRDLVESQLLYRAAEIALAEGAEGFVVLDSDTERDSRSYAVASPRYDPFYAYPFGPFWHGHALHRHPRNFYWPGWGYGYAAGAGAGWGYYGPRSVETREVTRYTAHAQIRIFSGEAPTGLGPAYVAAEVAANLRHRVNRPPSGKN